MREPERRVGPVGDPDRRPRPAGSSAGTPRAGGSSTPGRTGGRRPRPRPCPGGAASPGRKATPPSGRPAARRRPCGPPRRHPERTFALRGACWARERTFVLFRPGSSRGRATRPDRSTTNERSFLERRPDRPPGLAGAAHDGNGHGHDRRDSNIRRCSARISSSSSGAGPSTGTPGATSWIGSGRTGPGPPPLGQPAGQLRRGHGVHDPAEAHPPVRGRAHRAVLTRGVDRRRRALLRRQVVRRPLRDLELGVPGLVAVLDPVAVLEPHHPVAVDEHRPERLVAVRPAPRGPAPRSGAGARGPCR